MSSIDDNGAGSSMECSVCLQTYVVEVGTTLQLPCTHGFCVACVAKWWQRSDEAAADGEAPPGFKCPLCRSAVPRVWLNFHVGGHALTLERLGAVAKHLCSLSNVTYDSTFGSDLSIDHIATAGPRTPPLTRY